MFNNVYIVINTIQKYEVDDGVVVYYYLNSEVQMQEGLGI